MPGAGSFARMGTAVVILAVAGVLAVLLRAARALFALLRGGADAVIAREVAAARLRRGDITGLQDATAARAEARRRRYSALGVLFIWAGLLVVPALTPWPAALYASYSLLWLLPRRTRIFPT